MRTSNRHLTAEEIENAGGSCERPLSAQAERHLDGCEECRGLVEFRRLSADIFDLLGPRHEASRLDGCPSPDTWIDFERRIVDPKERDEILVHASRCNSCGRILAELLDGEDSDEIEEAEPVADARWVTLMAERMTGAPPVPESVRVIPLRRTVKRGKWIWPLAAMLILGVTSAILMYQNGWPKHQPPFELLAKAFTAERPNELRFPDANYAPVRVNRGSGSRSNLDEPRALLDSEAEIARELEDHPDDPDWLDAKARAELFRGNSGAARKSLERALDTRPGSVVIERDMASAWFESGEAGGGSPDFGRAAELFSRVLRKDPHDPIALFNRAVTYERMSLFQQAKNDWQKYLQLQPRGGWSEEARRRLNEVNEKLSKVSERLEIPLEPGDPQVMELLHSGYGSPSIAPVLREKAQSDLSRFAAEFEVKYQDSWLSQFIEKLQPGGNDEGVEALYRAFEINQVGDPSSSESEARRALRLFDTASNRPGSSRARFELAYGLQLSSQGKKCFTEARKSVEAVGGTHFYWLRAQAHLEVSAALAMEGDFHQAIREAASATSECEAHGLQTLRLRGLAFQAGNLDETGRWRAAWNIESAGLTQFWSGHFPPYRAYQFYDSLSIYAERRGLVELARALAKEGVFIITDTGNGLTEAMERYKIARMAVAAGDLSEAHDQLLISNALFDSMPSSPTMAIYRAYNSIWLARTKVKQGNSAEALHQLSQLEPVLAKSDNEVVRALLYSTLAEAQQHLGNRDDSERALEQVVEYGERTLRLLRSDEERLTWAREMEDAYRGLIRTALDRGDHDRALAIWEWYRAAGETGEGRPSNIQTAAASLQSAISDIAHSPNHTTIVSYVQLDDGLAAWSIDERGARFQWLPVPKEEAERYARRFAEACSKEGTPVQQTDDLGTAIYEKLVGPLGIAFTGDRAVLVEGDGPTSLIPFEAVRMPSGAYLGDVCRFVMSPGLLYSRAGGSSGRLKDLGRLHVLAVGNPRLALQIAPQYPSLSDAVAEAEIAASLMPNSVVLTDKQATASSISNLFSQVAIFHFAGHAIATPEHSGLLVAAEPGDEWGRTGFWDASSLKGGSLRTCALVVLSACSTGQFEEEELPDANTLIRAFFHAGAQAVIASRWPVDSTATGELMGYFYEGLRRGETAAVALSSASRRLKERAQTRNPRFWAAFTLFAPGEVEIPVIKNHRSS